MIAIQEMIKSGFKPQLIGDGEPTVEWHRHPQDKNHKVIHFEPHKTQVLDDEDEMIEWATVEEV